MNMTRKNTLTDVIGGLNNLDVNSFHSKSSGTTKYAGAISQAERTKRTAHKKNVKKMQRAERLKRTAKGRKKLAAIN